MRKTSLNLAISNMRENMNITSDNVEKHTKSGIVSTLNRWAKGQAAAHKNKRETAISLKGET